MRPKNIIPFLRVKPQTSYIFHSKLAHPEYMFSPFNSQEWPRENFSLQYQYNVKQTSDENRVKYQWGDYKLIQYQNLQTNITRTVCQTVRKIPNEILGVKGLTLFMDPSFPEVLFENLLIPNNSISIVKLTLLLLHTCRCHQLTRQLPLWWQYLFLETCGDCKFWDQI